MCIDNKSVGKQIALLRTNKKMTQSDLGERLNLSYQAISKWENELTLPNIMTIPPLASLLEISPEFLVNAIWIGSSGNPITHFVQIFVREANNDSYMIKIYEAKDFWLAKKMYDDICKGKSNEDLEMLISYYEHDKARTFSIELLEVFEAKLYDEYYEFPIDSLRIESCALDSLIKEPFIKGGTKNETS